MLLGETKISASFWRAQESFSRQKVPVPTFLCTPLCWLSFINNSLICQACMNPPRTMSPKGRKGKSNKKIRVKHTGSCPFKESWGLLSLFVHEDVCFAGSYKMSAEVAQPACKLKNFRIAVSFYLCPWQWQIKGLRFVELSHSNKRFTRLGLLRMDVCACVTKKTGWFQFHKWHAVAPMYRDHRRKSPEEQSTDGSKALYSHNIRSQ